MGIINRQIIDDFLKQHSPEECTLISQNLCKSTYRSPERTKKGNIAEDRLDERIRVRLGRLPKEIKKDLIYLFNGRNGHGFDYNFIRKSRSERYVCDVKNLDCEIYDDGLEGSFFYAKQLTRQIANIALGEIIGWSISSFGGKYYEPTKAWLNDNEIKLFYSPMSLRPHEYYEQNPYDKQQSVLDKERKFEEKEIGRMADEVLDDAISTLFPEFEWTLEETSKTTRRDRRNISLAIDWLFDETSISDTTTTNEEQTYDVANNSNSESTSGQIPVYMVSTTVLYDYRERKCVYNYSISAYSSHNTFQKPPD